MKYTLEDLRFIIGSMIKSGGNRPADELVEAIIEIIRQDREYAENTQT